jgi:hypothetical protein
MASKRRGEADASRPKSHETRVVLQSTTAEALDFAGRRLPQGRGLEVWAERWRHSRQHKTHPVVRLTEQGIDWGAEPRAGDEVGYCMDPYRYDDCFQAAVATATQTPIEQVPDLELDRRLREGADFTELNRMAWERIGEWADSRGLRLHIHGRVPAARRRWIGVVVVEGDRARFNDHCLVMDHDRLVLDPMCSVRPPPGTRLRIFHPNEISYGISFDPKEE